MKKRSIYQQIKNHVVAIISLCVAVIALLYTTWREEVTEKNRSTRVAAFEMLKNLGELQLVVNYLHYQPSNPIANPFVGWGYITFVGDLSLLLPKPVPETVEHLIQVWKVEADNIKSNEESADKVSREIDKSRNAIVKVILDLI